MARGPGRQLDYSTVVPPSHDQVDGLELLAHQVSGDSRPHCVGGNADLSSYRVPA